MIDIDQMLKWLKANVKTGKIKVNFPFGHKYDYEIKFRLPKHIIKTKILIKGDVFNRMNFIEEFRVEIHTLFRYFILTSKNEKRRICKIAKKIIAEECDKW